MKYEIRCLNCGRISSAILDFRCSCGAPLEIRLNFDFEKKRICKWHYSLWRYISFFPYVKQREIISLGEGWTPLVKFSDSLYFKMDHLNPTGSFKDRGSTVLISALHKPLRKAEGYISEDSSGNAGASIAAYAARAGLKAKIYVPENVSGQKLNQTLFYGAEVVKVSGSRNRATEEAQRPENGKFYVGHVLHPLFRDGIRSLAYELAEQFNWKPPEHIYLPVSAGTLLLGLISGLVHLKASGVIDAVPRITACQTGEVSPLYHRFKGLNYIPPMSVTSVADALISVNPPLLELMVKKLKEVNGDTVMVEEDEIIDAFKDLARSGFLVEPSSAVACAAYKKQLQERKISLDTKTVIVLTGMGLKTLLEPYVAVQNRKGEKGALHLNVQNQIRRTIEKGRDKMADVIITFKIYPQDIMDLNELKAKIEKKLPKYASIYRTSEEPVAFGLNALIAHIMMPEKQEGALEELEQALQKVPEISQIETVMVRRT